MEAEEGAWTVVERKKPKPDPHVDSPSLEAAFSYREGASDKERSNRTNWGVPSRDEASREEDVPTTTRSPSQKDSGPRAGQRGVLVLNKLLPPSDRSNAAEWPALLPRDGRSSGVSPPFSYSSAVRSTPRTPKPQAHSGQVGGERRVLCVCVCC